jgi:glycosyltransferase involved in cell wall biosynthesis
MPFLEEALASIQNQTYGRLEILCIDDGSSDGTLNFLKEKERKDPRIRVLQNTRNLGLIETLNKGIREANGTYIARMDADDIALPERITKQMHFLESNNLDLVGSLVKTINEEGDTIPDCFSRNSSSEETVLASFLFTPIIHPTMFAKKAILEDNLYAKIPKALHTEDYELWSRLIQKGYRLANHPETLLLFRSNLASVSHKFAHVQQTNFAQCARDHYNTYFKRNVPSSVYSIVVNRFETLTHSDFKRAFQIINTLPGTIGKFQHEPEFVKQHKMNILVSVIRKGSAYLRVKATLMLLRVLVYKESRTYFFQKFNSRK